MIILFSAWLYGYVFDLQRFGCFCNIYKICVKILPGISLRDVTNTDLKLSSAETHCVLFMAF